MEDFLMIVGIIGGLVTLVTFVATSVWVVAQIDKTTSNLGLKIENLGKSIDKLSEDYELMDSRVRNLEAKH